MTRPSKQAHFQAIVIGSGIVGLSCAFFLNRMGFKVVVVDRNLNGDRASFGNAGAVALPEFMPVAAPGIVWKIPGYLLNPYGPLSIKPSYLPRLWPYMRKFLAASNPHNYAASATAMSSFLSTAFEDHETIHQAAGLGGFLRKDGHLWVYRSSAAREASPDWNIRQKLGWNFKFLEQAELQTLEPALGQRAVCAVKSEDWATYTDPKTYVLALMEYLRGRGVLFQTCDVRDIDGRDIISADGRRITFDKLVIAAGAWAHYLSKILGDACPLETERGYNTTLCKPGISLTRMITFAQDHFVATPMSMGLRIGGAVEFAGLDEPPNFKRSKALLRLAKNYLPGLNIEDGTEWMGHRPSTPDSLPVIGRATRHENVIYAFGHGHLGLTGSATTGRVVSEIICEKGRRPDLKPFRIERFAE